MGRIKRQIDKFGFHIGEVGIDSGYNYEEIYKGMFDLGIKTYVPYTDPDKFRKNTSIFPISVFEYNECADVFICPNDRRLKYSYINRNQRKKIYRSSTSDCINCPHKSNCIGSHAKVRKLTVSLFYKEVIAQISNFQTARYYEVQRRRRILCEGNFANQKESHNLRRTRKRGNANVTEHCLCSNLKRLVKHLKSKHNPFISHRIFSYNTILMRRIWLKTKSFSIFV